MLPSLYNTYKLENLRVSKDITTDTSERTRRFMLNPLERTLDNLFTLGTGFLEITLLEFHITNPTTIPITKPILSGTSPRKTAIYDWATGPYLATRSFAPPSIVERLTNPR